jgi:hypothetical protein
MNTNKQIFAFVLLVLALLLVTSCIPITKKGAGANATGAAAGEGASGAGAAAIAVGIEVSINNATKNSTVHYFLDGMDETFTVKGTDTDLIIWEIAKKYNVSLNKVRRTIAFDGTKYSSEMWVEGEGDGAVPAQSGTYNATGQGGGTGASGADEDGDLWFDAHTAEGKGYTTVHAYTGDEEFEEFKINFEDKDVVIVEIKNKYGLTMSEARAAIKFDGEWYVSRSNVALASTKTTPESAAMRALAANLTYLAEKDEGFLRAVACDLNNSLIKINFTNTWNKTLLLFAERKPQIPDSLRFVLNGKTLYNLDCGRATTVDNSIDAGATLECIKSGAYFIRSRPDFYTGKIDRIYVTMIGVSEYLDFDCK